MPAPHHPDQHTDETLLNRARGGDVDAFESFYRRYRDWAIRFAGRYTRDTDTAIDVTQAVFCRLLDRIHRIDIERDARAYLAASLRNEALTRSRKRPTVTIDKDPIATPAGSRDADLTRAINTLPDTQREVLILWAAHGLTHAQIAEVLGLPLGTVKTRARAAVGALRGALGPDSERV